MPIRKEFRSRFYGRHWRDVVRPRILRRAGGKFDRKGVYKGGARCEQCKAIDGAKIVKLKEWPALYFEYPTGQPRKLYGGQKARLRQIPAEILSAKVVEVQIGVAHKNHTPGDDRDENLAALCRGCHLKHDEDHHSISRGTRKDQARPLFRLLTENV